MSIIFLLVGTVTLAAHAAMPADDLVLVLVALLVCLIPTTIGGLLSAIGIGGMDRLVQQQRARESGRAVEAAGDVDVLLLDKTGTITLGNRMATEFAPRRASRDSELAERLYWRRWPMRRRRAAPSSCWRKRYRHQRGRDWRSSDANFVPFSAQTRMSGVDLPDDDRIRKGAVDAVRLRRGEWRSVRRQARARPK